MAQLVKALVTILGIHPGEAKIEVLQIILWLPQVRHDTKKKIILNQNALWDN